MAKCRLTVAYCTAQNHWNCMERKGAVPERRKRKAGSPTSIRKGCPWAAKKIEICQTRPVDVQELIAAIQVMQKHSPVWGTHRSCIVFTYQSKVLVICQTSKFQLEGSAMMRLNIVDKIQRASSTQPGSDHAKLKTKRGCTLLILTANAVSSSSLQARQLDR
jgi:hypothetical protein